MYGKFPGFMIALLWGPRETCDVANAVKMHIYFSFREVNICFPLLPCTTSVCLKLFDVLHNMSRLHI